MHTCAVLQCLNEHSVSILYYIMAIIFVIIQKDNGPSEYICVGGEGVGHVFTICKRYNMSSTICIKSCLK